MRAVLRAVGTVCIVVSLVAFAGLAYFMVALDDAPPPWIQDTPITGPSSSLQQRATISIAQAAPSTNQVPQQHTAEITHISLDRIGLDADVVPAQLVDRNGATTWEVPAFKVGHAEGTAAAGEAGNAVLLGHVTSVHSGNVFQHLDQARSEDIVQVLTSDQRSFSYRVTSVTSVPRTDSSVLEQGQSPALSLITCTGMWLPTIWDYTERLVVRAELVQHTQ